MQRQYADAMTQTPTPTPTATTGYGESVPVTHIGRFAAVVLMLFMPIIIAFITASTTKSLNLTPDESELMSRIDANRLRLRLLSSAASLIQDWWRKQSGGAGAIDGGRMTTLTMIHEMYHAGQELKKFYTYHKMEGPEDSSGLRSFIGLQKGSSPSRPLPQDASGSRPGAVHTASPRGGAADGLDHAGLRLPPRHAGGVTGASMEMEDLIIEMKEMKASHAQLETLVVAVMRDVELVLAECRGTGAGDGLGNGDQRWCREEGVGKGGIRTEGGKDEADSQSDDGDSDSVFEAAQRSAMMLKLHSNGKPHGNRSWSKLEREGSKPEDNHIPLAPVSQSLKSTRRSSACVPAHPQQLTCTHTQRQIRESTKSEQSARSEASNASSLQILLGLQALDTESPIAPSLTPHDKAPRMLAAHKNGSRESSVDPAYEDYCNAVSLQRRGGSSSPAVKGTRPKSRGSRVGATRGKDEELAAMQQRLASVMQEVEALRDENRELKSATGTPRTRHWSLAAEDLSVYESSGASLLEESEKVVSDSQGRGSVTASIVAPFASPKPISMTPRLAEAQKRAAMLKSMDGGSGVRHDKGRMSPLKGLQQSFLDKDGELKVKYREPTPRNAYIPPQRLASGSVSPRRGSSQRYNPQVETDGLTAGSYGLLERTGEAAACSLFQRNHLVISSPVRGQPAETTGVSDQHSPRVNRSQGM